MASRLYSHMLGTPEDHVLSLTIIVTREPLLQNIMEILNSLCLSKGVRLSVAGGKPSPDFQFFFEQYFVSLLPQVLRYKLYCGFIPWIMAQHPVTGDRMPLLLPIGSFTWYIRTKPSFCQQKRRGTDAHGSANTPTSTPSLDSAKLGAGEDTNRNMDYNCFSEYVVQAIGSIGVAASEICVINLVDPMICSNNMATGSKNGNNVSLGQAQFSPLYVPLQKYLALDLAQQRRCYADDWNTTARLFTTKATPPVQNERAGRDEIPYGTTRFQQAQMPEGFFTYENMQIQYQNTSDIVKNALEQSNGRGSEHVPSVYSLPTNYNLAQGPQLTPIQDIAQLELQYRTAVAHSLGLPLHLIESTSTTARGMSSDELPFSSRLVRSTCDNLTSLMNKVLLHMYSCVYQRDAHRAHPIESEKQKANASGSDAGIDSQKPGKDGSGEASQSSSQEQDSARTKSSENTDPSTSPSKPYILMDSRSIRFSFSTDDLYSDDMKKREDEKVELQKAPKASGATK
jgi:hypothetical protein